MPKPAPKTVEELYPDNPGLQRTRPQAPDSEQSILGALITAGNLGLPESLEALGVAQELLEAGDFHRDAHREIWEAICRICGQGETPDLASVMEELDAAGLLDFCGGGIYLRACLEKSMATAPAYITQHARRVREAAVKRRVIDAAGALMAGAYDGHSVEHLAADLERLSVEVLRAPEAHDRRVHSAPEVMAMNLPPARWAVPGLIPEGLTLMVGGSKLGKSFLAYQVALAIASGGTALGKIPVERGTVLYLALEDTWRRVQARLGMFSDHGQVPPGLHLAREWRAPAEGGIIDLSRFLDDHPDTRLIIVDTFAALRGVPDGRANVYYLETNEIREFKRLADARNVSIILVHHTNKAKATEDWMAATSGSTGLVGGADGTILLDRKRGQQEATLKRTGRDIDDEADLKLVWDEHAGWVYAGRAEDYNLSVMQKRVLSAFAARGWQPTTTADLSELMGQSANTTRKQLYRMSVAGLATCTVYGSQSVWTPTPRAIERGREMDTSSTRMSQLNQT